MFSITGSRFSHTFYFTIALVGVIFALLSHLLPGIDISISVGTQILRKGVSRITNIYTPNLNHDEHRYEVQLFSWDPLIIVIRDFLSSDEITHLLRLSENAFEPSTVYRGNNEGVVDPDMRISESAAIDRNDSVVRRLAKRAKDFQGWRGDSEPLTVLRYNAGGFLNYHYDWDEALAPGNRVSTFMVYLVGNCTGGGTNFPYLPQPNDTRWCDVIECDEAGRDGYQGVTFKPIAGSAVYWENFRPNGSGHTEVYHAGLPVKSGVKIGINIWSFDSEVIF